MPFKDKEKEKEYYEKNKEKIKEKQKEYYKANKEKKKEKGKEYYEKNKEKKKEKQKEYYEANKKKKKEKQKEHYEVNKEYYKQYSKTENGKKSLTIGKWKYRGLTDTDLDYIYELYKNTTNCWVCNHDFSIHKKCLDHDHITGEFRQILCHSCNSCDFWKKYSEWV